MATYKAEFLPHHYAGRLRPRGAHSIGLIFWWAEVASLAPGWVNAAMDVPGLGNALRWLAGFAPKRGPPRVLGKAS